MENKTNELIVHLKVKIEKSAPSDPKKKKGREEFYQIIEGLTESNQFEVLNEIRNSMDGIESKHDIKKVEDKEECHRVAIRKRYEYKQRCYAKGKIPKEKPIDKEWLTPEGKAGHPRDIDSLILWDLYIVLNKANLRQVDRHLQKILKCFYNRHLTLESIKREISRMKCDPYYIEYEDFKKRSQNPH